MGKGATAQQNQIGASQQSFMGTLQNDFGTAFSGQQNIISGLNKSLQTTLAAGPSQFGFSTPETTALNTLATTGNAQQYANAKAAAGQAAAAAGGNSFLPSGSNAANQASIAESAAQNQSNSLLGIQEAGYKQGNQNYDTAVSGETSVAGLENPNGLASNANSAGGEAASTAATIQKENQAASPWAQVGGLVGSLGGAALNAFVPGAGSLLSGATSALDSSFSSTFNGGAPTQAFQDLNLPTASSGFGSPGAPIDTTNLNW